MWGSCCDQPVGQPVVWNFCPFIIFPRLKSYFSRYVIEFKDLVKPTSILPPSYNIRDFGITSLQNSLYYRTNSLYYRTERVALNLKNHPEQRHEFSKKKIDRGTKCNEHELFFKDQLYIFFSKDWCIPFRLRVAFADQFWHGASTIFMIEGQINFCAL